MTQQNSRGACNVMVFLSQQVKMCVQVDLVEKILPLMQLDPIPNCAPYIVGLMNFKGKNVLVYDLALRLNLSRHGPYSLNSAILVCTQDNQKIGVLIEKVVGIEEAESVDKNLAPTSGGNVSTFYSIAKVKDEFLLMLNADFIFSALIDVSKSLGDIQELLRAAQVNDE